MVKSGRGLGLRQRLPLVLGAFALASALVAAPAATQAQEMEGQEHAAQRLVVADAADKTLRVIDAESMETLASFSMPGPIGTVAASPSGRWVYAVHTDVNRVTVLDTGLRLEDHGDHQDLRESAPYVRGTVFPGRRPIDFWTNNGFATVHNDEDGTLAVFDEGRLEITLDYTEIKGEGTGHNNAVVLGDSVLLSLASAGRVTAYGMNGGVKTRFEGCPGTHGWTTRGTTLAASGCTDGVLVYRATPEGVTASKIAEPADSPENARVSTLISHPQSPVLIGNFGQGLAIVQPEQATLRAVPLPANPVRFAFDHEGKQVLVLTFDGYVQAIDAESGATQWRIAAVEPVSTTNGAPRPSRRSTPPQARRARRSPSARRWSS
jgi:DNA-binding beta-propeller fold protein YncE